MRSYFDNVQGDYSKLSEADKASFVKMAGGDEKAQQLWGAMKSGPGAASRTAPTPPGPPVGQ